MAIGEFVLDFFFGPCLDNGAVDQRQNQPRPRPQSQQYQSQRQQVQQQQPAARRRDSNGNGNGNGSDRNLGNQSGRSSKRLIYPPTIPENEVQNNVSSHSRRNMNSNGLRNSGTNGSGQRSGSSGSGHHSHKSKYKYQKKLDLSSTGDVSSLSDSFKGNRRYRRDDASNISASLYETYRGTLTEDQEDLDEQIAIRRSLKDGRKSKKKNSPKEGRPSLQQHIVVRNGKNPQRQSSDMSQNSNKTELETWIEDKGTHNRSRGKKAPLGESWENVTTISKASKNPYRVLGISQSASPKDIYSSYKRRMRETENKEGGDRAFTDVGNAYRRIKADIKRQEARNERRRVDQQGGGNSKKSKKSKRKSRRSSSSDEESDTKSRRENIDARLKDHRELVQDLFAKDNAPKKSKRSTSSNSSVSSRGQVATLQNSVHSQSQALSEMNLVPVEAGAANVNENNQTIQNSCFYLSLAASYLSGVGAFTEDPTASYYLNTLSSGQSVATVEMEIATLAQREKQLTMNLALQLKRAIEAAVLLVHPDWAKSGMVGEEIQAFSDFLVYALDSDSVLGHWAIAVFDEASGFVDIYRGRHYGKVYPPTKVKKRSASRSRGGKDNDHRGASPRSKWKYKDCDDATKRANTLTLRYIPGHYQPLLPELTKMQKEGRRSQGGGTVVGGLMQRPTLEDILSILDRWNVLHVVTDGRA